MLQQIDGFSANAEFEVPISRSIWAQKYQYRVREQEIDLNISDTWIRVAHGLASCEAPELRADTTERFLNAMEGFKLLPAGRILAGCGTKRDITLSNTFVMQTIEDSVESIMDTAKQAALTMKMGGGLGYDFSTIRPKGSYVSGLDCPAAGPIAAMEIFDAVCNMVVQGMGRGAMMATLRDDHPDIEDFITAKSQPGKLRNFNMSVMVSDALMKAVDADDMWHLTWEGEIVRSLPARDIWHKIMQRTYEAAEPGVLFIDRINQKNPMNYCETITSTNSCAEQPLPPNGTCPLASINLSKLVIDPFSPAARLDFDALQDITATAVRMLDNTLDVSRFANEAQKNEAMAKRRVGLGVTAVADTLIMLGVTYGSNDAIAMVENWMRVVQNAAYAASADLAAERGSFPAFDAAQHLTQPAILQLEPDVRAKIAAHGLRNAALTSIAPTGTISMLAGNVSSGIEPVFATSYTRLITNADGTKRTERVDDYAVSQYYQEFGQDASLPEACITAMDLDPRAHVAMQAAAQKWVDGGISKTVNCPVDMSFEAFKDIYRFAFDAGCKGCTTFRPNATTGSILTAT